MHKEYGMKERDKRILKERSVVLCREMVVEEILIQTLQTRGILTNSMAEEILKKKTNEKRSWQLLLLLPKRGPKAFNSFCAALKETEQLHLYDLLTECCPSTGVSGCGLSLSLSLSLSLTHTHTHKHTKSRARTNESMEASLDADSPATIPVQPCTQEFYLSHWQQAYKMTSSPRGLALVLSNVNFDPSMSEFDSRRGGEVDEEVLRKLFVELDFKVLIQRDLSAQDMRKCIEQFSQRTEHRDADCCAVSLLSHGIEGAVYGIDGQPLKLDWVFEAFNNAHCHQLQNKPKVFFIQACRGEEMDCGVDQLDGPGHTQSLGYEQRDAGWQEEEIESERREREERDKLRVKLPQRSDMICGFASLKGTAAMRNTKKGSWFVQELNMMLRQRARDTHLSDILVQVNGRIKEREGHAPGSAYHRCKEMSEFTSSLCKDLYLFPKYFPQS
uniref:Caspase 2 n=1 Tax=Denticeps clupeoides TaxID=299321 RepID=A0AAY3ZW86_9TELE